MSTAASSSDKPTVLIVGAGLGGLMLGALLEKSNVPYAIFERSTNLRPLGSAMAVGPTLLPIFQQLGIYEEFLTLGKYLTHIPGFGESDENLYPKRPTDFQPIEEFTGYGQYIVARPKLYELLYKQVPPHKIHLGKRVLNITEENDRVAIHTADNGTYEGDILVGADGAYSAVRQRMYDQLKGKGDLPKGDQEELPFSCTCLVGQTRVLDPKEFPILDEENCQVVTILSDNKPFTWSFFTTRQNTLVWSVVHQLDKTTSKAAMEQRFRNSENSGEWGAIPAQTMCEETQGFPIPLNGEMKTMGDIYALTPKEFVSKVMREEKVFETWYSGRVVLLGDACHKLSPSGGHGAVTALHDAIALSNLLYAMPTSTSADITNIFRDYQKERYPAVMESYNNSRFVAKVSDRGIIGRIVLYLITHMPMWLWRLALAKTVRFRPQVGFLEAVGLMGSVPPVVSPSEQMARAKFERQQRAVSL
ncbi:hypothetical protein BGZ96_002631 [Linnemannia gamsii]|uniref:FAD-binding domain-containing protein n=1 Tax=Linnemannia gamsii TaxID=64522 RepID=A0ABQ7K7U8_9FUNG|nr:hypothetical protein BGZ96_002631 [Linnemannia gamsii]